MKDVQIEKVPAKYLPIGSVVKLEGSNKTIMIYGIAQITEKGNLWDYVACLYPEGNIGRNSNIFFNHEAIEEVLYKGFETDDFDSFQNKIQKAIEGHQRKEEDV